jgi:hypothetical protein
MPAGARGSAGAMEFQSSLNLVANSSRKFTRPFYPDMPIGGFCPRHNVHETGQEWSNLVKKLEEATQEAGREGDRAVCLDGCWIQPARMPRAPPHDSATEADGGRAVTIFLQSAPRIADAPGGYSDFFVVARRLFDQSIRDAGTMMLATLNSLRRSARLAHAPAILIFDGLNCNKNRDMHPSVARAYVDKIVQIARLSRGSQAQLLVHDVWLHAAESTRRAMLLKLTDTPLVFVGDDDFIVDRPVAYELIYRLITRASIRPRVRYVHLRWLSFWCGRVWTASAAGSWDGGDHECWKVDLQKQLCHAHPLSNGTLWSQSHFNNQPHFALTSLYMETVWPTVPFARTAIEHHANAFSQAEKNWNGWSYVDIHAADHRKRVVTHLGVMGGRLPSGQQIVKLSANRFANASAPVELGIQPYQPSSCP